MGRDVLSGSVTGGTVEFCAKASAEAPIVKRHTINMACMILRKVTADALTCPALYCARNWQSHASHSTLRGHAALAGKASSTGSVKLEAARHMLSWI